MLFSTEQVSKYHPDKYADQISDKIVSLALSKNINSRCAVETLVKNKTVVVAGELGGVFLSNKEIKGAIHEVAEELGYEVDDIIILIDKQSNEISKAVEIGSGIVGAGDQGMMFGYATRETETWLPYGFDVANKIIEIIEKDVLEKDVLKGDAKTQVTVNLQTKELKTVLISVCHNEKYDIDFVRSHIEKLFYGFIDKSVLLINPAGSWSVGGAIADSGLTGRKIVADQYGGYVAVGGGAFSGKDLSKVDRSGSYVARNIAIDVLKNFNGIDEVEIQLSYAIGVEKPVGVFVKTNKEYLDKYVEDWVLDNYDLTPKKLIERLNLKPKDFYMLSKGCHYRGGYVGRWK